MIIFIYFVELEFVNNGIIYIIVIIDIYGDIIVEVIKDMFDFFNFFDYEGSL